jgi:hypothetical protein
VPVPDASGGTFAGDLAILFLTHAWSTPIAMRFARLWQDMSGHADCFLLLQDDGGEVQQQWKDFLQSLGAGRALMLFKAGTLEDALGYKCFSSRGLQPGSVHFPLLAAGRHTHYRHYWLIEHDVEYRGLWSDFFRSFAQCEASLLAVRVQSVDAEPDWHWAKAIHPPPGTEIEGMELRRAFLPIYRISKEGLDCIDACHQAGWRGHFELLIPTVLRLNDLSVQDLREVAPCYLENREDPLENTYTRSTVRFRPEVSLYEFSHRGSSAILFHPVKGW